MSLHDFIKYPLKILLITGVCPVKSPTIFYRIRGILSFFTMFTLICCLTYNASLYVNNFVKFSASIYMLISLFNVFWKITILFYKRDDFLKLVDMIDAASFPNANKYQIIYGSISKDFKRFIKIIEWLFFIQINGALIPLLFNPVTNIEGQPLDFPYFNKGPYYYPFWLFETLSLAISAYNNMAMDLLAGGFIAIVVVKLKLLNKKLIDTHKNVQDLTEYCNEENVEELTVSYIVDCCKHYNDITIFVKQLIKVFSIIIFVQLGTSIIAICNAGIMILNVNPISMECVALISYLGAMVAELGIYCWIGNFVYVESLDVNTSCYLSDWYLRGTKVRKTLFMLMERTKKPLQIKGLNFAVLTLDTFIAILKWSYSYFALLNNNSTKD